MRPIKFRGKRLDNGKWAFGDLIHIDKSDIGIVTDYDHWQGCRVDPNTVGQFTGILDKNGKEIYEGDIVLAKSAGECRKCQVVYVEHSCGFCLHTKLGPWYIHADLDTKKDTLLEVIGNKYDNPL